MYIVLYTTRFFIGFKYPCILRLQFFGDLPDCDSRSGTKRLVVSRTPLGPEGSNGSEALVGLENPTPFFYDLLSLIKNFYLVLI